MIGNWVSEDSKVHGEVLQEPTPVQVDVKLLYDLVTNNTGTYNYEPILLTSAILDIYEFEDLADEGERKDFSYIHKHKSIYLTKGDDGYYLSDGHGQPYSENLKSLHQLQNLYYCLTDEELKIDL